MAKKEVKHPMIDAIMEAEEDKAKDSHPDYDDPYKEEEEEEEEGSGSKMPAFLKALGGITGGGLIGTALGKGLMGGLLNKRDDAIDRLAGKNKTLGTVLKVALPGGGLAGVLRGLMNKKK